MIGFVDCIGLRKHTREITIPDLPLPIALTHQQFTRVYHQSAANFLPWLLYLIQSHHVDQSGGQRSEELADLKTYTTRGQYCIDVTTTPTIILCGPGRGR